MEKPDGDPQRNPATSSIVCTTRSIDPSSADPPLPHPASFRHFFQKKYLPCNRLRMAARRSVYSSHADILKALLIEAASLPPL
ncbi:hypothetical protein [Burkholderia sp. D-99]|uniref:hypothetical protein n=1 Tax=Burkholderia sp. D-99 TaxID=2717316 RepID=UPI00141FCFCB|nr:hypothetical protein [Burkholderia sp. D-99]NHV28114.1 hypothetical protein [Burkholderia sp. D-99]